MKKPQPPILNRNLLVAETTKQIEFYTQFVDVEKKLHGRSDNGRI